MKGIEFLLGTFLLGSGIGICNQASWGMDPFDVMTTGISAKYQIPLSIINLSIYLLMCLVVYYLDRKQLSLWTCLAPFITSFGIEVVMRNFEKMTPDGTTLILHIVGMMVVALGTALSVEAEIGKSPYDSFIYGLMNRTKKSYAQIRWGVDGCCLIIGIIIGGSWGIGTLLSLLAVGKMMEAFQGIIRRVNRIEERGILE